MSVVPSASSLVIRALKEPPRDRKKEKNIKHNKSVALDEIIEIARTMRFKSFSKSLEGTVKEVLGTAFSVGCQVDGKSPKAVSDAIEAGEIDSKWKIFSYHRVLCASLPLGRRTSSPPPSQIASEMDSADSNATTVPEE